MSSETMHQIIELVESEAQSRPSPIEFETAYQARIACDRIRFAIRHTEQFPKACVHMREACLQLLDALERLERILADVERYGGHDLLMLRWSCRDVLKERLQAPGRWVFPSAKNPGEHIGQHQRLHAAALKKADVSFVPYDCRHTFATRAVERGMELPKLMAILGHSNLRSIMKYVHMTQGHIDDGMRKFETGAPAAPVTTAGESKNRLQ